MTPLLLVTGFLGSGKTTLIAALLRRRAARAASGRIGLLVNELGAVGIDGDLLADGITAQVELPGGCVCCALGDDLAQSIVAMLDQQPNLDAIILETTGVAEPLPIAWALERAPLVGRVRLATVITLVDAENFLASRPLSASVDAQVAYADILLQTKSHLVSAAVAAEVQQTAMALAGRALWYALPTAEAAQILDDIVSDPPLLGEHHGAAGATPGPAHGCGPDCHEHGHAHAVHGISSVAMALPATGIDLEDLEDAVLAIPDNAIRIKGIVQVVDGDATAWVAFHRVGPRFSSERMTLTGPAPQPRIVALGSGVTEAMVQAPMRALFGALA
ncbi:MAG TPA: GTP-binding protein [Kofleriaceae bacterium]|nr:GTP-binding protein [Kofleriaceae bacterium]